MGIGFFLVARRHQGGAAQSGARASDVPLFVFKWEV